MSDLKALIIAAGRGIRLGARGKLTPKGLLKMDGVPLVRRSVSLLHARGIQDVVIVTGHLREQYEAEFQDTEGVELVHNPNFATTDSLNSLMVGLKGTPGPVVVLESDLIYEAQILSPVFETGSRILVSGITGSGDEVYVWTREGKDGSAVFRTMSKKPKYRDNPSIGEFVGISVFDAEDTKALIRAGGEILARTPKADYESAVIEMAKLRDIACFKLENMVWTEMDDEAMYRRAVTEIWPQIRKRDGAI